MKIHIKINLFRVLLLSVLTYCFMEVGYNFFIAALITYAIDDISEKVINMFVKNIKQVN